MLDSHTTHKELEIQLRTKHLQEMKTELNRLTELLKEMGALKIILFGSCAMNTAGRLSDLDIFVIMETDLPFVERLSHFYKILLPSVPTDLILYTPAEFVRNKDNPFIKEILKNGKIMYKKAPHEEGLRWLMQAEADRKGAQALFDAECFHLVCFLA
ncbi:MAG: nucleotidyltransferase domain-containing protein [Methanomicrobiales archaeon]|nr:nucleotidyltransferase domain-containing protein [Methanomicrobiales archaeon]